ncbi:MAG: hypothetical protein ACXVAN_05560 [Polyangia bacterium]
MIMMALTRRKRVLVGAVAFVLVAVAVCWRVFRVSDLASIGAGYSAEQTCACMFIAHRPLDSCMGDLDPLARKLISVHPGDNSITASGFGLSSATARFTPNFGCTLQN